MEQYMMATIQKKVLYIEGETDLRILRAFAKHHNEKLLRYLDDRLYYYTTQTQHHAESSVHETIE